MNLNLVSMIRLSSSGFKSVRYYATRKRFYKNTSILHSDNKYEITLDHRKLKTPNGSLFTLKSEPLAVAVATEWNNQKQKIIPSQMHITGLCSTAIDNPYKLQKEDMINYLLNYVQTDTILYHSDNDMNLNNLQKQEWDPVIEWFNKRYDTNLKKTLDITTPTTSEIDKMTLSKYFISHNIECLHGFVFAIDTLKSIILALAAIEQFLTVEKAVSLARLEEEFQLGYWGRVEWAHDLSQQDSQSRLAAAILFIHFNRSEHLIKSKLI